MKVGLPDGAVLVEGEVFLAKLAMEQFGELILGDVTFVEEALQDQLLLFFPGGVGAEEDVHIEDVVEVALVAVLSCLFLLEGSFYFVHDVLVEEIVVFYGEGTISEVVY